jgi:hypothetical protein
LNPRGFLKIFNCKRPWRQLKPHSEIWLSFLLTLLFSACAQVVSPASTVSPVSPVAALTLTLPAAPSPTPQPTSTQPLPPTSTLIQTLTPEPTQILPPQFATKAVVLIIIDGTRWSETFGDSTHELIPHLANDLAPLGAINTTFYNDGLTVTIPGHASILTGTWQDLPNNGQVRPTTPTIFEYYRAATGASEEDAIFVHGSFIEPVLTYSTHPDYGPAFGAKMFFSNNPAPPYDDGIRASARQALADLNPPLLMISLLDPDEAGHAHDWEGYRQGIRHDDEIIWDLWQQLQADQVYAGQTTLIVTNDHGRGCGDGWPEHGGDDECNRHIMFLAVGPDIQPGLVVTQRRTQRDIAPTIGYLLGFETPFVEGEVMTELWTR